MYFRGLVAEGFVLTFKVADDASIVIKKYGSYLYDHLILFSPTVEEFGGALSAEVSYYEIVRNHIKFNVKYYYKSQFIKTNFDFD